MRGASDRQTVQCRMWQGGSGAPCHIPHKWHAAISEIPGPGASAAQIQRGTDVDVGLLKTGDHRVQMLRPPQIVIAEMADIGRVAVSQDGIPVCLAKLLALGVFDVADPGIGFFEGGENFQRARRGAVADDGQVPIRLSLRLDTGNRGEKRFTVVMCRAQYQGLGHGFYFDGLHSQNTTTERERVLRLNELPRAGLGLEPTRIEGLWRFIPDCIEDERGFFLESYRESLMQGVLGRPYRFAQSNHSRSKPNTLRGFRTEPWDKLIYVARGTALLVVVDPRRDSPTFGQHERFLMGDAPGERQRILLSRGLCNAFYCLTETDYLNDVSAEYEPSGRKGFRWDDPALGIDWPCEAPVLSAADRALPDFATFLEGYAPNAGG